MQSNYAYDQQMLKFFNHTQDPKMKANQMLAKKHSRS